MDPITLRPPLLYGEYELTIDDKNRFLIPSEVRKAIRPEHGDAFFMTIGINQVPWLYTERYYEHLATQDRPTINPGDEQIIFDQRHFALASRMEWDKQGRVLIPEKTLKRTGLGKIVTLIGARDHLELWNRGDWEAHRERLIAKTSEIALRARQSGQT